jgi:hypothetical protein
MNDNKYSKSQFIGCHQSRAVKETYGFKCCARSHHKKTERATSSNATVHKKDK